MNNKNQHIPVGYKSSPLGIIPEDWEVKRLGEIFTFKNGVNAGKDSYGEGVRFVNTMDVLNNAYLIGNSLRGRVAINEKTKIEFLVSFGDVLFNRTSETREEVGCSTVYLDNEEAVFGGFVIRAHDKDANILNPIFKQYCFQPSYVRNQISALGNGAIRYNLGQEDLSKVNLLIPTKAEQESIVSLISLWDTAISKQIQLVEKLTLRKRGLMQQLLTGEKRLKGFEGKWKKCAYSSVLKEIKRTLVWNEDELYKLISVRRRSEGLFFRGSLYGREIATKNLRPAKTGDFLISKMQIVHGASGLVTETFDNAKISGSYIALVAKDDNVLDMEYFNLWSQTPIFYHQTFISSFGVHIEKMTFDLDTFMSFGLSLPSINEQRAIVSVMKSTNKEIELAKQKLSSLQEQKKGLMQVLLTGKKRIII